MESFLQRLKPLVVTLLALLAALAVSIGAIQLRALWQGPAVGSTNVVRPVSDPEKLAILAELAPTSSPSTNQKSNMLHTLSSGSTTSLSDDQRLKILNSLH